MARIVIFLSGTATAQERFGTIPAKKFHVGAKLKLPITCTVATEECQGVIHRPCRITYISRKLWFAVQFEELPIRESYKFCIIPDEEGA